MLPLPASLSYGFSLLSLLACLLAMVAGRKENHRFFSIILFLTAAMMLVAAIAAWNTSILWQAPQPLYLGIVPLALHLDSLACVFLGLLAFVTISISLFSPGYLSHLQGRIQPGQYWAALFLFLLSMALVVLSANAISFLVFWELMSLSSVILVATEHKQLRVQQATLIYLGATRVATALLASGFLWMHTLSHSWNFVDWRFTNASEYMPALLILLGFCIKSGIWPFHIWLPYAHPAAPSPVSALMSGVMIKIALYGIIRILFLGGLNCPAIAYFALAFGAISAFWGVLFALVQHDLKRLLAYSSVENVGLILMGIAVAILARASNLSAISALALTSAIFHCVNHGLFKSLLFLGAGGIDAQAHTRDLLHLGGLARSMPWTMACFLVGSAAVCALPPLNGFASKWFLYQSLLQTAWESTSLVERAASLAAIGVLAIVGGLAIACFTKAVGVAFLGNPRLHSVSHTHEASSGMIASQLILAAAVLLLGITVPAVLRILSPICSTAIAGPSSIDSAFPIPMATLALALFVLIAMLYFLFLSRSSVRRYITWECGFGDLSARTQVTANSFTQPIARIFSPILRYKIAMEITGKDRRHFPDHIKVESQMMSLLEARIYIPALGIVAFLAKNLAKLQAGSIHLYLLYVCFTLILLLLVGTQL